VASDGDGGILTDRSETIGVATNNVAEYRALLLGIELAKELAAEEVEFIGDSELIVRQVLGEYKVKKPDLKPLHAAAQAALRELGSWSIRSVPREQNAEADALVNETLDASYG
jgi:ribonuclease HI